MIDKSLETDIDQVLNKIPERQSDVLRLFFGLGNQQPMSLVEIGEVFDVTRERVRQIKDKGLRALRRTSNKEVLRAYL
jgi:RNA polymerase primary sigma factor